MCIKASTTEGNADIVNNLEKQVGTPSLWFDEFVCLCHGDLSTQEWHNATKESHCIEKAAKNCLQGLINIPGIFHIWMTCVDTLWRIYISLKDQWENEGRIFNLLKLLWPKDTAKIARNLGYWIMNDGIQHLIKCNIILCWEEAVHTMNLVQWLVDEKPSWGNRCLLATEICKKYIVGPDFNDMQEMLDAKRDWRHENQLLFNCDGLMYSMLAHATNMGVITIIKDLLWHWVPIFSTTGKHKYAAFISKFPWDLHLKYPPWLSWVIKQHWLCNPTGAEGGFHGIQHIVNQSLLIEIYWMIHVNPEDDFYVKNQSDQHAPADMQLTVEYICHMIHEGGSYTKNPGSEANEAPICSMWGSQTIPHWDWAWRNIAPKRLKQILMQFEGGHDNVEDRRSWHMQQHGPRQWDGWFLYHASAPWT